jgi:hypothetical protein
MIFLIFDLKNEEEVRDSINENGVGSPTINPTQKGRTPQQHSLNDKKQCKYNDKY